MRPIYKTLNDEKFKNQIQFHMPGHLRGRGFDGFNISGEIDVTELYETDDLHSPSTVIKASEENAADIFGSNKAYYVVNGSTGGVLAMVMGFAGEGEKIIADRFCHKSFVSALMITGSIPVWVYSEILRDGTMWGTATYEGVKKAIENNPDAKAVFITAPNYFGIMGDVEKIARLVHENGMYLLVDGAHGAHYGMSRHLPPSVISMGADAVCLSLHKTLPSLTQTAILLTKGRYERLEAALRIVQSSSPSYILMSSCEYAVDFYGKCPKEKWERLYGLVEKYFPEEIGGLGKECIYKDFTRLNISLGGNGYKGSEILREQYNIAVECAYGDGVIAILNVFHSEEEIRKLKEATDKVKNMGGEKICVLPKGGEVKKSVREAFFAKKKEVNIKDAVGKIAAEGMMVYPPGIYQILPGEVITEENAENILLLKEKGADIPFLRKSNCLIFDE